MLASIYFIIEKCFLANIFKFMRRSIPTTQSLLCFESAAKLGNYTNAAKELCLTQSAVSRQIQQLESFLGVNLFTRTQHGVELTTDGLSYYQSIKPHLIALEQSSLDIFSNKGKSGTLKLGVVPTFGARWLVPKIADFQDKNPNINLQIETNTKPIPFSESKFDAMIFAGTAQQIQQWAGIKAHFLMKEDLILVSSPTLLNKIYPSIKSKQNEFQLKPEQLINLPLLQQTTRPTIWQEFFQYLEISHPNPYEGQRHELFSMISEAAIHNMGIALLPEILIEAELRQGQLVRISSFTYKSSRNYYFIHSLKNNSKHVPSFLDWLTEQIQ